MILDHQMHTIEYINKLGANEHAAKACLFVVLHVFSYSLLIVYVILSRWQRELHILS